MPAPVRAVVMANAILLAFCALEVSDGLIRSEGRVFYWTTILFVPAIVLHGGLVVGQRWAWWVARGLAALGVLWFAGFLVLVPFADLHGPDGPIPWWGRVYTALVTIVFVSIFAYAFRALGHDEARRHFGLPGRDRPAQNAAR
jgi:Zn-dependent protease